MMFTTQLQASPSRNLEACRKNQTKPETPGPKDPMTPVFSTTFASTGGSHHDHINIAAEAAAKQL